MDVTKTAQDAAYIAVGFGVIAFQRAQVLRNDLSKLDLVKVDLPRLDLPNVELPSFELPNIDLTKIDLTKIVNKVEDVRAQVRSRLAA